MERVEEQQERSRKEMVIREQRIWQLGSDRDGDRKGSRDFAGIAGE